jgi:hypothetical protein
VKNVYGRRRRLYKLKRAVGPGGLWIVYKLCIKKSDTNNGLKDIDNRTNIYSQLIYSLVVMFLFFQVKSLERPADIIR